MGTVKKNSSESILKYLERRTTHLRGSSNLIDNFWSSQLMNFSTEVSEILSEDKVSQLPLLTHTEGLYFFYRVAPYLKSIEGSVHFCKDISIFRFGTSNVKIERLDFLDCLNIITKKCVSLEYVDVRVDASECQMWCEDLINPDSLLGEDLEMRIQDSQFTFSSLLKSNPKLKTLTIRDHVSIIEDVCLFPQVPMMSNLKELTLSSYNYDAVRGFSLLSENLTLLDLSELSVHMHHLSDVVEEILRHKKTLQTLKINIISTRKSLSGLSKLTALRMCSSLKILQIKVAAVDLKEDYSPTKGDVFFADIIKGCTNLEFVYFSSVSLNDETVKQLYLLPNFKQLFFLEHEKYIFERYYL